MDSVILSPYNSKYLGKLKNRIVMAPMSRWSADQNHCVIDLMSEYYIRRAKDGVALIITEGLIIHPSAAGHKNSPYIYTAEQANSWKKTISGVHRQGAKMFCQLWHCGRISHEDFTGGIQPVSSSAKRAEGINKQNNKPYARPRALTRSEIKDVYEMFIKSGELAFGAGFDGAELHFGHGYLVDQFFDSRINERKDEYGGSVDNRCRFALELTELFINKFGSEKVMVRISPSREMAGVYDWPEIEEMLACLISNFNKIGLRLLDISCASSDYYKTSGRVVRIVRPIWPHFLVSGASLSLKQAEAEVAAGLLDMVTWGRYILANPDFVSCLLSGKKLNQFKPEFLKKLY